MMSGQLARKSSVYCSQVPCKWEGVTEWQRLRRYFSCLLGMKRSSDCCWSSACTSSFFDCPWSDLAQRRDVSLALDWFVSKTLGLSCK